MSKLNPALFISAKPVPQTVTMPDGTEEVLHFKQLSRQDVELFHDERNSPDVNVRTLAEQRMIARCLCDEDGNPVMTLDDCARLTVPGVAALLPAVLEVNRAPGKASTPDAEITGSAAS